MRKFMFLLLLVMACCTIDAAAYVFTDTLGQSEEIDVEYWTGTGVSETILVVDWNYTGDFVTRSHAFGYRWDGSDTTLQTMLDDITSAGNLSLVFDEYIRDFLYTDEDGDIHTHPEDTEYYSGGWNFGSTGNLYAQWGEYSGFWPNSYLGQWEANAYAADSEYIADGYLEGVNAVYYWDQEKLYLNDDLNVPFVPEPGSLALLAIGSIVLKRKRA